MFSVLKKYTLGICVFLWLQGWAPAAWAANFTGAGSSAAAPIYRSWGQAYEKVSGNRLVYESAGSSAGMRKIKASEVGYGATDVPPSVAELGKDGLVVFPIAVTGIAPVVNLPRIGPGQLRLDGTTLARIFMGQIARWNAPEIAQLNPGLALPGLPIKVIVRSDGSGTTYNFSDYLAKVHADARTVLGVKTTLNWPQGFVAAKGSEGVAKAVRETSGAIGYIDFGYVGEFQLVPVQLAHADGEYAQPSYEGFRAALMASDWVRTGNFTTTLTRMPGGKAWPITMGTFVVLPKVTEKSEETLEALRFFSWCFMHGDALVKESNFVRLPDRVQAAAFRVISTVQDKSGRNLGMQLMGF